jgi:hypothetical protein
VDVQTQREYTVEWRFISLWIINEQTKAEWYTPEYRAGHYVGHQALRVATQIKSQVGNDAVGAYYTALGERLHVGGARDEARADTRAFLAGILASLDLPGELVDAADNASLDVELRESTELAFSRTGRDVGTPILTFHPGQDNEGSFFGPVISKAPKGDDALKLWDAIEVIATTSGVSELKRSNRGRPDFS